MKSAPTKRQSGRKTDPDRNVASALSCPERLEQIATSAYYKAEARGFQPGRDMDDWLEAEAEYRDGKGR